LFDYLIEMIILIGEIEAHSALLNPAMKFVLGGTAQRASQNKFHSYNQQRPLFSLGTAGGGTDDPPGGGNV
jgi:hypothetical protein